LLLILEELPIVFSIEKLPPLEFILIQIVVILVGHADAEVMVKNI
jgi:hypothetical protein